MIGDVHLFIGYCLIPLDPWLLMIQYSSIINYYIFIYSKVNFTWLGEKERERKKEGVGN